MDNLVLKISEQKLKHFNFKEKLNDENVKYEKKYNTLKKFNFLTLQVLKNGEIVFKGIKKSTIELLKFFYNKKDLKENNIEFTFFEKSKKIINGIYLEVSNYFKTDKELLILAKDKLLFDIFKVDRDLLRKNAPDLTIEDLNGYYQSYLINKEIISILLNDLEKISNISEIYEFKA